jgi:beta-lactamase regulating signal transducer with metallopeptidase domain
MMSPDALSSIARATVEALFNGLWQGIALCALVGAALACHRSANAATRYAIWWVALVAIACLPLVRTAPVRRLPVTSRMTIVSDPVRPASARPAVMRTVVPKSIVVPRAIPVIDNTLVALRPESPVRMPVATVHLRNRWPVMLFCAWLAGALLMLARLGWSFLYIRRLRRASEPLDAPYQNRLRQWLSVSGGLRRVKLAGVEGVSTPMSLGPIDPIILMPTDFADRLTEAEFDQVLLHELAHIRRGDNWTNLFQKLVEAVLFFHPAVWWTAKRLDLERESACDDWVVHMTGEVKPYAACLAKLAEVTVPVPQPALATGIFRGAKQITTRIERLLDRGRNATPWVSRLAFMPAVILLAGVALVCSEMRTVLAGPVTKGPFAAFQPAGFAPQAAAPQATPQAETPPSAARPPARKLEDQLREIEDRIKTLQSPETQVQLRAIDEQLETLRSPESEQQLREVEEQLDTLRSQDLDSQLDHAREQILQLQQDALEQLARESYFKDLDHQLLASQDAMRRAGQELHFQESNGFWTGLNVRTKGQIEFTDDDSDVKSVSPGGRLSIEERRGFTTRKYEVTPSERRYSVNGQPRPIDEQAKAWIADVLPQIIRDSAVGADARVKRILKQHGPNGVLDEIAKISSDHAKRIYFAELFANGPLPQDVSGRAARHMGREISSDGEKARLLIDLADLYLKDGAPRVEYFDAINTIASDGEHRRVLSNVLQRDGRSKETLRLTLKSATRIASDGEKARLLMEAADVPAFDASASADYLHAVDTIASDGEHARVLLALMRLNGLSKDTLVMAMRSASRIASDGEKGRVLARASEFYTSDPALRSAFFNAAATIASDGEHSRVLTAVLAKSGLDKESFIEIIGSAAHIASDGDKGRVLREVATICPNDDAIVSALMQAIETISSDGEYRRVMSVMMGRADISAKISKIKYI